jgi:hypothetical protein
MNQTIHNNSELICTVVTIITGAIIRAIEKRRLKKKGLLITKDLVKVD